MSNVIQFQRRALESLLPENQKPIIFDIDSNKRYLIDDGDKHVREEIFLQGISEGIGTCSDLHNVNIAVFSFYHPLNNRPRFPKGAKCVFCNASALLRVPLLEEWSDKKQPHLIVEGLELWISNNELVIFKKTGKKALYADLV